MSSKENPKSQDKKTKKKKSAKSESKAAVNVEEQVDKGENLKEQEAAGDPSREDDQHETSGNIVENVQEEKKEDISSESDVKQSTRKQSSSIESVSADKQKNKKSEDKVKVDLEKLIELKEAFSLFDFNRDGIIDLQDLKYTFISLGKPDFPEEEMQKMLKEAGEPVNFDSFVKMFGFKVSMFDTEDVFTDALATWDMRGVGMIPEDRLKRDIQCFGDKFNGKDADHALEEAPVYVSEGASMIDYAKFSNNICGFRNVEETRKYQKQLEEEEARKYQ